MDHVELTEGLRIAYRRTGQGPPLVLLHGAMSDSRAWRPQLEGLADDFTVVAWDMPGCGASSDPPAEIALSWYADALAEFIAALGLRRPHVLGLSFGGGLALELYRRHPDLPRTLVLAAAYAGWAGSLPADEVERRRERVLRETELPPEKWVRGYLPGFFTESAPPELIEEALEMMSDTRASGLRAMITAFAEADLRDVLDRIDVPTLLLYGDADVRSPPDVAEALHARIPTSRLVILPGAGHASNLEFSNAFDAEVRRFLLEATPSP